MWGQFCTLTPLPLWKVWYIDNRKIFFKLRLIFFNHVNNVIDVYIQSSKRFFFCLVLLNLSTNACNGSWMSMWICGNDQAHSHSCPIVARKYVFTRFKTLNDISDVAVVGSIVSKLFKIYTIDIQTQVFVYKFQCLTMMEFPLCFPSALWL